MATARKKWTILDTVQVAEAVISNDGKWLTDDGFEQLVQQVSCTRGSAETVFWRMQTVLGYAGQRPAQGITVLDRAVAQLYLGHDPRLKDVTSA
ncbi:hypothetical protein [Mycobacteroides abscessus]|uniref:hypothetical protein n=1 Tax=Mycobacteroides abscessus TaxID=36809 RepID=UPI00092B107C|nr:hypothetical protein [Mycobacteroides abscessus]SHW64422.1 Uncharacterised protein [Mycobacteroides abscessus subsp. abscessus]SHZ89624.1 Uncharacterised protein [Mycobacteroides abscessus subsp. abscessus]SKQ83129.1 Uncharacterised protein [Mycobacteroides abscessus subsp. abscessus]